MLTPCSSTWAPCSSSLEILIRVLPSCHWHGQQHSDLPTHLLSRPSRNLINKPLETPPLTGWVWQMHSRSVFMRPYLCLCSQTLPAPICVFRASPSPLEQHGCCQDLCPSEGALGTTVPWGLGEHHQEYLCFCIFPFRGARDVAAADQRLLCPKRGTPCWLLEMAWLFILNFAVSDSKKQGWSLEASERSLLVKKRYNKASAGCGGHRNLCLLNASFQLEKKLWSTIRGSAQGQVGLWASCYSDRWPCPQQESWTRWFLKVPSETNQLLILWKAFHTDPLHFHWFKFPWHHCPLGHLSRYFA